MTTKVLIVYASKWGNTKKMAEAIEQGAKSVKDTEVMVRETEAVTEAEVVSCDALILGSPVHMGSPDWKIKKFIDTICSKLWTQDRLNGKVGAVFATGGGYGSAGGGAEITMLALLNNLAELGLIMVPLPKNTSGYPVAGLQWGPYARSMGINGEQTGVQENMMEAARHHGKHVARLAAVLKGAKIFGEQESSVKA